MYFLTLPYLPPLSPLGRVARSLGCPLQMRRQRRCGAFVGRRKRETKKADLRKHLGSRLRSLCGPEKNIETKQTDLRKRAAR